MNIQRGTAAFAVLAASVCGYALAEFRHSGLRDRVAALEAGRPAGALAGARPTGVAPRPIPDKPVDLQGAQLKGRLTAAVAVIEYSDFQCPFCARFYAETLSELSRRYIDSGQVLLAFRHLPLPELHENALKASEAAECAGQQSQFWPMHDALFDNPARLDPPSLAARAERLKLDMQKFEICMRGVGTVRVRRDASDARSLGIASTPTFLMGRYEADGTVRVTSRLSGAKTIEEFARVIDPLLAGAR